MDFTFEDLQNTDTWRNSDDNDRQILEDSYATQLWDGLKTSDTYSSANDEDREKINSYFDSTFRNGRKLRGAEDEYGVLDYGKDIATSFAKGAASIPSVIGQGLDFAGLDTAGDYMKDVGKNGEQYWEKRLSPTATEAIESPLLSDKEGEIFTDTAVKKIIFGAAESAPGMLAMAPGGAALGAGMKVAKFAPKLAKALQGVGLSSGRAGKLATYAEGLMSYGTSESVYSGLQNAVDMGEKVSQLSPEELSKSPVYYELLNQYNGDEQKAKEEFRDMVERDTMEKTALATFAGSIPGGGGVLSKIAGKGGKGLTKNVLEGLGSEALQETGQSGLENIAQNVVTRDLIDSEQQDIYQGTLEASVTGGLTGGLLGMAGGAFTPRVTANDILKEKTVDGAIDKLIKSTSEAEVQPYVEQVTPETDAHLAMQNQLDQGNASWLGQEAQHAFGTEQITPEEAYTILEMKKTGQNIPEALKAKSDYIDLVANSFTQPQVKQEVTTIPESNTSKDLISEFEQYQKQNNIDDLIAEFTQNEEDVQAQADTSKRKNDYEKLLAEYEASKQTTEQVPNQGEAQNADTRTDAGRGDVGARQVGEEQALNGEIDRPVVSSTDKNMGMDESNAAAAGIESEARPETGLSGGVLEAAGRGQEGDGRVDKENAGGTQRADVGTGQVFPDEEASNRKELSPEESDTLSYLNRTDKPTIPNEKNKPIYDSLVEKGFAQFDDKTGSYRRVTRDTVQQVGNTPTQTEPKESKNVSEGDTNKNGKPINAEYSAEEAETNVQPVPDISTVSPAVGEQESEVSIREGGLNEILQPIRNQATQEEKTDSSTTGTETVRVSPGEPETGRVTQEEGEGSRGGEPVVDSIVGEYLNSITGPVVREYTEDSLSRKYTIDGNSGSLGEIIDNLHKKGSLFIEDRNGYISINGKTISNRDDATTVKFIKEFLGLRGAGIIRKKNIKEKQKIPVIRKSTSGLIERADKRLQEKYGLAYKNSISKDIKELFERGSVEVGYRATAGAGAADPTYHKFGEFLKVLKSLKRDGFTIREDRQKHGNAYATSHGGFWNSSIYSVENYKQAAQPSASKATQENSGELANTTAQQFKLNNKTYTANIEDGKVTSITKQDGTTYNRKEVGLSSVLSNKVKEIEKQINEVLEEPITREPAVSDKSKSTIPAEYKKLGTEEFVRKYGSKELKSSYFILREILPENSLQSVKVEVTDGSHEDGIIGQYIGREDRVEMFTKTYKGDNVSNDVFAATLLHEIVHAITYDKLKYNPEIRKELESLRDKIADELLTGQELRYYEDYKDNPHAFNSFLSESIKSGERFGEDGFIERDKARLIYMLLSNDEFLANATHPVMQNQLSKIEAEKKDSIMDKIKRIFQKIFNWSSKQYTAYEQAMSAIGRLNREIEFHPAGGAPLQSMAGEEQEQRSFDKITTEEQDAAIARNFGVKKTLKERAIEFSEDWKKNVTQGIFDQFAPLLELDSTAYFQARLTKGGDSTLEAIMMYGVPYYNKSDGAVKVKFDKENNGKNGFASVLAELDGEHDLFMKWVAAHRASRLKEIGLENLMSKEDIAILKTLNRGKLRNGKSREQAYSKALVEMNKYNNAILKIAVDRGLINDSTRQMYQGTPYIPFYRLNEEDVINGFSVPSGLVNQKAWKRLKGGTNKLNEDMLANMLKNWSHLITSSSRNEAAKSALEAALREGYASEVPSTQKGKNVVSFRDNVTTKLVKDENGEYKRVEAFVEKGKVYMESGVMKTSDGTLQVEYNVERNFLVHDPHILDAITSIGFQSNVPKVLRKFKHFLTVGVTANPTFKIRNLIRDSLQSIALAEMSFNPAKNIKEGLRLAKEDSEVRAQLLAGGGIIRFGAMLDGQNADMARQMIEGAGIPKEHILDDSNKISKLWKHRIKPAIDIYQEFGDRGEQVNRLALYNRLINSGMSHGEASFWARDLMDFSMSGKWAAVRFLTQTVPFMNARLQGLYKLGRSTKANKKRVGAVIGGVTIASLALLTAYGEDKDWKKREDWDRDNYWWFKIGDIAFRIPKPFEIGAIGTIAERSAELLFDKEMTGKRFRERLGNIVSQQLSMNPTPQLVKPLIDLWANKDSFSGRPIESMGMERLKKEDRYNENTSGIARVLGYLGLPDPSQAAMGKYSKLSPVQIDFLIRGYFSWLGTMTTTALDYGIFDPLSDKGSAPSMKLKDTFLIGNFLETLPANSSRYVTQMYDQAKEIEEAYASYKNAIKIGDKKRAYELMKKEGEKILKYKKSNSVKNSLSDINQEIKKIRLNKSMTSVAKRKRIDYLNKKKSDIAESVN